MSTAIDLFDGTSTGNWKPRTGKSHLWQVVSGVQLRKTEPTRFDSIDGTGVFYNGPDGNTSDIYTDREFGDCRLHVEFCVPKDSNSGVYLMGRYEIQILDSWGKNELSFNTCGGIYARWIDEKHFEGSPPLKNMSKPPGQWQSYDAVFQAPTFDANGNKTGDACFVEVVWNGVIVQQNVTTSGPTRAAMFEDEAATGPLMFQGDHGPVAYRNIRIESL